MIKITKGAQNNLNKIWELTGIRKKPDFSHWSLAYAREAYSIISGALECGVDRGHLASILNVMGVWDLDATTQQWEPRDDRAT